MNRHGLFAIVLAAGSSSRFGSCKQLAEYRGQPLVRYAVRAAESVCGSNTVLVAGDDWQAVPCRLRAAVRIPAAQRPTAVRHGRLDSRRSHRRCRVG